MPDSEGVRPDPNSVYRVIQVVSSHPQSWEEAARLGVEELGRTIADLRVARVVESDVVVDAGAVRSYRVKLAVSYRLDRHRIVETGGRAVEVVVRRVLLVANRTTGGAELMAAIEQRLAAGPTEIHVLVPVLVPPTGAAGGSVVGDAYAGTVGALDADGGNDVDFAWSAAEQRLAAQLELLRAAGATATGELRPVDPLKATLAVLGRSSFDEVIVSTLPAAVSRWLRLDLPRRLARHTALPIVHIEQSSEG